MTQPPWMPEPLRDHAFSLQSASQQGIGRFRQDSPELNRPFKGVRTTSIVSSPEGHAEAYLPRLKHRQVFGGVTAIRLLGLPWIRPWSPGEVLELSVPGDAYTPRSKGVRSQRLAEHRFHTVAVGELPVLSPFAAVMSVADRLSQHHLIGLMDALVCRSKNYPRLRWRPMCASVDALQDAVEAWGPSAARTRARAALPFVRPGAESFPESMTRLVLTESGLPEPELHPPVATSIGTLHPDGGWSLFRVGYEYEGDQHRTNKKQWEFDIRRQEALAEAKWRILRVTSSDLRQQRLLCQRVRGALNDAGWTPGSSS